MIVDIPEQYLIVIAGAGKMGSGELLTTMQYWARKECKKAGLSEQVREFQKDNILKLRQNLENTLGKTSMKKLDKAVVKTLEELTL